MDKQSILIAFIGGIIGGALLKAVVEHPVVFFNRCPAESICIVNDTDLPMLFVERSGRHWKAEPQGTTVIHSDGGISWTAKGWGNAL